MDCCLTLILYGAVIVSLYGLLPHIQSVLPAPMLFCGLQVPGIEPGPRQCETLCYSHTHVIKCMYRVAWWLRYGTV
jgi:hypothetical protein